MPKDPPTSAQPTHAPTKHTMGIKYLTAYAEALGPRVVRDLTAIPRFRDASDGATTNVVVLDASGGLARWLKPDDSERNLYDYQELFERVAVDVAALRALGYEPVPFLDAAVPRGKLPTWKARRRAEFVRLGKIAQAVEWGVVVAADAAPSSASAAAAAAVTSPWAATATTAAPSPSPAAAAAPPSSPVPPPPSFPKNCWVPPEAATQHLADAFAAAGCEVYFGRHDVDLEAAAEAARRNAFAVLTCDSDLYVSCRCRVWSFERFDVEHGLWRREGDDGDEKRGGGGGAGGGAGGAAAAAAAASSSPLPAPVWLPPDGSPGVRGETRRRRRVGRPRWLLGGGGRRPMTIEEEEAQAEEEEKKEEEKEAERLRPRGAAPSSSAAAPRTPRPPPQLYPRVPVREVRTDLLRAELGLPLEAMPLLAACLGNDAVPHIARKQLEAVLSEHTGLPALPASA
jgi:hypothetical protein